MKAQIEISGVTFDVEYTFYPAEPDYHYRDGDGCPGYPAYVEIRKVTHKGTDFTEFFGDNETLMEQADQQLLSNEIDE